MPGSVDRTSLPYTGAVGVANSATQSGQNGGGCGGGRGPRVGAGSHSSSSMSTGQ